MRKLFYILLISGFSAYSQNPWQICGKEEMIKAYQKICDWLIQTNNYSFNLKYTSYKNHLTREIEETSKGYYKRNDNNFKCEAMGVLNFQNGHIKVSVDSADKIISVSDPGALSFSTMEFKDLEQLLANVKMLRKKTEEKSITYRIDFKKNELIEAYEFKVNSSGLLERSVYFYCEQIEKEYPEKNGQEIKEYKMKPRLEIDYSDYKYPARFNESEFSETAFVAPETNKLTPAAKYKSYRLMDYRYKAKK